MSDVAFLQLMAILGAILVTILLSIFIAFVVFYLVGRWKLYQKLGLEGWESIVPFYGKWVLFKKLNLNWYWFLIYFAPLLYFFYCDYASAIGYTAYFIGSLAYIYNIAKRFNRPNCWTVMAFVFPFIALPLLGCINEIEPDESAVLTPNAMFDDKKKNEVIHKVKKVSKKIEKAVENKTKVKKDK